MKRVEMNADGLVELQALEAEGMFGGADPSPYITLTPLMIGNNLVDYAVDLVQGFIDGWNFDKG